MKHAILVVYLICAAAGPAQARELVLCDDVSDPQTLDPQKEFSDKNHTISQQIFDGLIRFDPEGKIEPALAASWERVDDRRTRFKLREGVYFHNGEPFDSDTVKFSIERYLDPATGYPGVTFIDSMSRVEVIDAHTVDIITKQPDGILLNRLAGLVLMVPPKYITEKGAEYFSQNPVGTGAFVFKKWKKGRQLELSSNKGYWLKGFPKVDGLVFKFIPYEKQLKALFSGEVDLLTDLPGTQTLKVMANPKLAVLKKSTFYTIPVALNLSSGPLSNLDARKALNHAVNKKELIRYDLLGNGTPIATLSMPGEVGHNSLLVPYEYNPEKAKSLLVKAGYPNGFSVTAVVKKNAERAAKIITSNLRTIGVTLHTTIVPDADLITEVKSGKYDMVIGSSPDPMCHVYFIQAIVLASKSPFAVGGDLKFDRMLEKMVSTVDPEKSKNMAEEIDKYVYDNAMSIFNYQKMTVYGFDKRLSFLPYTSGAPYFFTAEFSGKTK